MPPDTLLVSGFIAAGGAVLFAYVGLRLARREVSLEAQPALQLFATWWFLLAGTQIVTGGSEVLAWMGVESLGLHAGLSYINLFFSVFAIHTLLYYLLYVFTGGMRGFAAVTLGYLAYFLTVLYLLTTANPIGLDVDAWTVAIETEHPISGPVTNAIVGFLLVPPLVATGAYLRLYAHVESRTQRYRVLVIGTSIALWLGSFLVVYLAGADQASIWPLISKLIGLAGAVAVLVAYFPPRWIRERGIESLGEGSGADRL